VWTAEHAQRIAVVERMAEVEAFHRRAVELDERLAK
jgi:hypothetical protein